MGFLQRGLLIYMCLAIAMCFAAPQEIFNGNTPAENSVLSIFNLQYDSITNEVGMQNYNMSTAVPTDSFTTTKGVASSGSILGFLDPLYQIWDWVRLFFKVLFSPIIILIGPAMTGAPSAIVLLLGIPLVFMTIFGLIVWIRSGMA